MTPTAVHSYLRQVLGMQPPVIISANQGCENKVPTGLGITPWQHNSGLSY